MTLQGLAALPAVGWALFQWREGVWAATRATSGAGPWCSGALRKPKSSRRVQTPLSMQLQLQLQLQPPLRQSNPRLTLQLTQLLVQLLLVLVLVLMLQLVLEALRLPPAPQPAAVSAVGWQIWRRQSRHATTTSASQWGC